MKATKDILSNASKVQFYLASQELNSLPLGDQQVIVSNLIKKEVEGANRPVVLARLVGKYSTTHRKIFIEQLRLFGANI